MAAREVPDVTWAEIDDLALAEWIDGGDAAIALEHIGPFGGTGVPVELAQRAGLERHVNPGELVGHSKAGDVRFLGGAAVKLLGSTRTTRKFGSSGPLPFHSAAARSGSWATEALAGDGEITFSLLRHTSAVASISLSLSPRWSVRNQITPSSLSGRASIDRARMPPSNLVVIMQMPTF